MRMFVVADLNGDQIYSEDRIIHEYWPYWKAQMEKKFGKNDPRITMNNCIDDWIVINWAQETNSKNE